MRHQSRSRRHLRVTFQGSWHSVVAGQGMGRYHRWMGSFRTWRLALAASCALVVSACAGHVQTGSSLYQEGYYIEAAEVFERTEHRLAGANQQERAEYGAYRGMTLLRLGDLQQAHQWLAYAYELERSQPGTLGPIVRAQLDQSWALLGVKMRQRPGPPPASETPPTRIAESGAGAASVPSETPAPAETPRRSLVGP